MTGWVVRHRDVVALATSAAVMLGTVQGVRGVGTHVPPLVHISDMTVALQTSEPEQANEPQPSAAPAVPVSAPPAPAPAVRPVVASQPAASDPAPRETAVRETAPTPREADHGASGPWKTPPPLARPAATETPAPPSMPTAAPPPHPPGAEHETAYVAALRRYLESIKRYPSSREARQLRPAGTVRLWIELDRRGQLQDAGIETGSGHALLDQEAMRTVRSGRYPEFPPDAWVGTASHRFALSLDYRLDNPG